MNVEKFAFAIPRLASSIQLCRTVALPLAVVVVVTCHTLYVPEIKVSEDLSRTSIRIVEVDPPAVRA